MNPPLHSPLGSMSSKVQMLHSASPVVQPSHSAKNSSQLVNRKQVCLKTTMSHIVWGPITSPKGTGLPQVGVKAAALRHDTEPFAFTDSLDPIPALNEAYLGYFTNSVYTKGTAEP